MRTPRETVARLLDARRKQLYHDVAALVVPTRSKATLTFLMSLDEFVAANTRLQSWLRDHAGILAADMVDQAYITDDLAQYAGDGLGLFSRDVELLDVHTTEGQATVSYSVPTRLIAREAILRRDAAGWRLDPGPRSTDELAAAFRSLADGLESVRAELEAGHFNVAELSHSPMRLVEKLQIRLRPGVTQLSKAQAAAARASREAAAAPATAPATTPATQPASPG